jgi:hypothetical protein
MNAAVYQTWSKSLGHIAMQWSPWRSGGDDYVLTRQLIVVIVAAVYMCRPLLLLLCLCALP